MTQEAIDFISFIEANPFTPVEVLFIDFFGKRRSQEMTIKTILEELSSDDREKMIQILYTAGFDDIL